MKNFQIIVFLTFLGFLFSCKNTNSTESTQQTDSNSIKETNEITENSSKEKKETTLYAWVDKLRIREKPTTKSQIVDEVKEGTSFIYLNEKTDYKERINLRGTLHNEPWLKIKTEDGKQGWVYGGAVKFYEPVVDANPSPYEKCFELKKAGSWEKFKTCSDKMRAKQLKKDARFVSENKDGVTLTLLNGKKIELKNPAEESDGFISYNYLQYTPQIGFFILRKNHYEGGEYALVNDKSGKETIIQGFPKSSPDNKYLVTCNADGEAGFEYNGVEIFGFPNGRFTKLFNKEWEGVEPHTPKWIDNKTIEVHIMPLEFDKKTKPNIVKIILNDGGDWVVQD